MSKDMQDSPRANLGFAANIVSNIFNPVPSGELTFSHGKIHHAINGKIHYFDRAIFHSFLMGTSTIIHY